MIKTLAAAAVLSLGLAGYAMAQDTHRRAARAAPRPPNRRCTIITTITIIITITTITCTDMAPAPRPGRSRAITQASSAALRS